MLDFESAILSKALSGDRTPLPKLREKARHLRVATRSRSRGAYSVVFDSPAHGSGTPYRGPYGDWLCLGISDTAVEIRESTQWIKVTLMVLFDDIQWMRLEGDFDFNEPFHVTDTFWIAREPGSEPSKLVRTAERDFKSGFGWDPVSWD